MEKGQLTTDIVTYVVPILFAVNSYISANPGPLEQYLGVFWVGLLITVIGAIVANYKNKRPNEQSYEEGYSEALKEQEGT